MDFIKKAADGLGGNQSGGDGGNEGGGNGFMDKVNSAAGGGAKGEQNEDYLDKGTPDALDCDVIVLCVGPFSHPAEAMLTPIGRCRPCPGAGFGAGRSEQRVCRRASQG